MKTKHLIEIRIKLIELVNFIFALEDLAIRKGIFPLNNWEETPDDFNNVILKLPNSIISKCDESDLEMINEWHLKETN